MIWKHQIYSQCSRVTRSTIIWILAVGVIIGAFYLMVFFKNWNDELVRDAGIDVQCPKNVPTIEDVLNDQEKPIKQRAGFRHCWCLDYQDKQGTLTGSWEELQEQDAEVTNLCEEWQTLRTQSQLMILITGVVIAAINGICVALFEFIPILFEKCLTYADETLAQFNRIFVIQFLNIGCLLLFADFGTGYSREEMGVPFLVGKHRDFDTKWYFDVGAKITVAMISNSLVGPFTSKMAQPFVLIFALRWFLDRCFKRHLRKLHNVMEERAAEEKDRHDAAKDGEQLEDPGDEAGEGGSYIEEGGSETNRQLTNSKKD